MPSASHAEGGTGARRALLVVNRKGRRADLRLDSGLAVLGAAGITAEVLRPDEPEEIPRIVAAHAARHDLVVLGGGDGTFSLALDAVLASGLPLGVLPMGNANDFARTLGIPPDCEAACRIVAAGHLRRVDVGWIDGTHFLNVASIGLSVRIARRLAGDRKRRWGLLAYPGSAWEALRGRRSFVARITCDGSVTELRSIQIAIGNGRYYGGGMTIVEDAAIDDGRLDLYALPRMPGWRLLALIPILRWGLHRPVESVLSLHGREIVVETDRPMSVNVDGEVRAKTPAVLRVIPGRLRVFAPPPP